VIVVKVADVARKAGPKHRSGCPVNISLEVFGDRWSLLIVRDLMVRGFTTFQDFLESGEGIATNILADRLKKLRRSGIVTSERDASDGRRVIYRLTEKGIDLAPVMLELLIWGARHEQTGAPPAVIAEMAMNRRAVLEEAWRRWRERVAEPLLPWLGGPRRK
jgi:DNA-binding HxlR family transcriptional regulator